MIRFWVCSPPASISRHGPQGCRGSLLCTTLQEAETREGTASSKRPWGFGSMVQTCDAIFKKQKTKFNRGHTKLHASEVLD